LKLVANYYRGGKSNERGSSGNAIIKAFMGDCLISLDAFLFSAEYL
jgi:hypothetical protein